MLMHNDDKVTTSLSLNIQGNEIELTDKLPLSRVSIDCNLNFSDHIKMAANLNGIGILRIRVMFLILDNIGMRVYYASSKGPR